MKSKRCSTPTFHLARLSFEYSAKQMCIHSFGWNCTIGKSQKFKVTFCHRGMGVWRPYLFKGGLEINYKSFLLWRHWTFDVIPYNVHSSYIKTVNWHMSRENRPLQGSKHSYTCEPARKKRPLGGPGAILSDFWLFWYQIYCSSSSRKYFEPWRGLFSHDTCQLFLRPSQYHGVNCTKHRITYIYQIY